MMLFAYVIKRKQGFIVICICTGVFSNGYKLERLGCSSVCSNFSSKEKEVSCHHTRELQLQYIMNNVKILIHI